MRPILWYDWPYIFRHRRELQSLDNVLLLTRGTPLSWTHLLSTIRPDEHVFTGAYDPDNSSTRLIGQIHQSLMMPSAQINYLLHVEESDPGDLIHLLDGLVEQAGQWGAKQVLADLPVNSSAFACFRESGFSVIAKQRIFQCNPTQELAQDQEKTWRIWTSVDIQAMRGLYYTLVPPLIQHVEPMTRREMLGLVHFSHKGEIQAYADLVSGPAGVWVLPVIHPQIQENITELLSQMLASLPGVNGRPVYINVRSYQPWVEHALEDLSAVPGPEQAMLVRYIALRNRVSAGFSYARVENGNPEPTFPLAPIQKP